MQNKENRSHKGNAKFLIVNGIRLVLVFAFFAAFYNGRTLVSMLSGAALVITFLPLIAESFFGVKIPASSEMIILASIYGSLFLVEVQGLFGFWWWDIVLNIIGAFALGLIGMSVLYALYREQAIQTSPLVIAGFALCFALSVGVLWEILEFSLDNIFLFHLQKSSADTMKDLIFNGVGALFVSILGYSYMRRGTINIMSKGIMQFVARNRKFFVTSDNQQNAEVPALLQQGENAKLEFKSTVRTNVHTNQIDRKMEHSLLKTVSSYLNADGGTLLVGVSDKGEIIGLNQDSFPNDDKMHLHVTNLIKHHIGNEYLPFIDVSLVPINGQTVLKIDCRPSDKHVFLKMDGEEEFFVRNGPASVRLNGNSLVDYIRHRFGSK